LVEIVVKMSVSEEVEAAMLAQLRIALARGFPLTGRGVMEVRCSAELAASRTKYHVDDMLNAPKIPNSNAPDTDENYKFNMFWDEAEFRVGDKLMLKASLIPPVIKKMITEGLRYKRLSWEYLMDGGFLDLLQHAAVPVSEMEIVVYQIIAQDRKLDAAFMLEQQTELFWRSKMNLASAEYNSEIAGTLGALNLSMSDIWIEANRYADIFRK
jgi:hypothetical protein